MAGYTSAAAQALANYLGTLPNTQATQLLNDRAQVSSVLNTLGFTIDELTPQDWRELMSNFG